MKGPPADRFTWLAVLPMALFIVIWLYVRRFESWGAIGAAPLLLIPIIMALPITIAGLIRIGRERRAGGTRASSIVLTVLAALPLLWFGYRLLITA